MFGFNRKTVRKKPAPAVDQGAGDVDQEPGDQEGGRSVEAQICPVAPAGDKPFSQEGGGHSLNTEKDVTVKLAGPSSALATSSDTASAVAAVSPQGPGSAVIPENTVSGLSSSDLSSSDISSMPVAAGASDRKEPLFQTLNAGIHTALIGGARGGQIWPFASIKSCLADLCENAHEIDTDDRNKERILAAMDRDTGLRFGVLMETDGAPENIIAMIFICILSEVPDSVMHSARLNDMMSVSTVMEEDGNILIAARPLLLNPFSRDLFSDQIRMFLQDIKLVWGYLTGAVSGRSMYTALEQFFGNESLDLEQLQNIHLDGAFTSPAADGIGPGGVDKSGAAPDKVDLSDDPHDDIGDIRPAVDMSAASEGMAAREFEPSTDEGSPTLPGSRELVSSEPQSRAERRETGQNKAGRSKAGQSEIDGNEVSRNQVDQNGREQSTAASLMPYDSPEDDCPKCRGTGRRFILACRECDGTGVL